MIDEIILFGHSVSGFLWNSLIDILDDAFKNHKRLAQSTIPWVCLASIYVMWWIKLYLKRQYYKLWLMIWQTFLLLKIPFTSWYNDLLN